MGLLKPLAGITGAVTRLFTKKKDETMPAINDGSKPVRFDANGNVINEDAPAPAPAPAPTPVAESVAAEPVVETSADFSVSVETAESVADTPAPAAPAPAPEGTGAAAAPTAPSLKQQAIAAVSNLRNRLTDSEEECARLRAELAVQVSASAAPVESFDDETFQRIIDIANS